MRSLWEGWKRVSRRIGNFQARLLFIFFYFILLGPFCLAVRWGSDPLAIKPGSLEGWWVRDDPGGPLTEQVTKQF
jgi:hypothetical protein